MSAGTGLYEQIKTDLGYLQLDRAAEVFATLAEDARTGRWTHIEYLARLLDEQAVHTRDRRLAARLRYAKFPFHKTVADFDFEFQPSIDPKLVADLATLRFIEENRPILFLGQPGCGKTHLAVALAIRVVEAGWRGYFTTAEDMCTNLVAAKIDGTWSTKLRTYTAPTILVIDDVGLLPMPDRTASSVFFQVVNTRYQRGHPTIVTTNRGLPKAHMFGRTCARSRLMFTGSSCGGVRRRHRRLGSRGARHRSWRGPRRRA